MAYLNMHSGAAFQLPLFFSRFLSQRSLARPAPHNANFESIKLKTP